MILTTNKLLRLILEELETYKKWQRERGQLDKQRVYDRSYAPYTVPIPGEKEIHARTEEEINLDKNHKEYWRKNADHDFWNNDVVKVFWAGAVEDSWIKKSTKAHAFNPNEDAYLDFLLWADRTFNIGALNKDEMSCVGYLKSVPYVAALGPLGYVLDGWVTYASSGDAQSEFTSQASKTDKEFFKHSGLPKRPNIKTRPMFNREDFVEPQKSAGGGEGMGDTKYNELLIDNSRITAIIIDFNHYYWSSFDQPGKYREVAISKQKELRNIQRWCDEKNLQLLDTKLKPMEFR